MELISIQALILLILAILFVRILPTKGANVGLAMLTVYVLYVCNNTHNFIITLVILAAVYYAGVLISKGWKPKLVATTVVIALAVGLILWKYPNFFIQNINLVTRLFIHREFLHRVTLDAPFGISYGFLILIAYILNLYWGVSKTKNDPFEYTHTVAFFPQWVMGPIMGSEDFNTSNELKVTYSSLCNGSIRIVWGIFKKLVISARCGVIVDLIYADVDTYGGLYILIATMLFVLQLYTDFSGAMDIVIGAGEIIGKKLPENFDLPFSSTNISEFWRRWHITLGAWLRTFVFYPLLKSRVFQTASKTLKDKVGKKNSKKITTYAALFVTWFLIGLWHGGSWNYIFGSGIYYWILIVSSELLQPVFNKACERIHLNRDCWSYQTFTKVRTTFLFTFGMLFFRSHSFSDAIIALKALFRVFNPWILFDGSLLKLGLDAKDLNVLVLGLILLYIVSRIKANGSVREWLSHQNLAFRWIVFYGLIFAIIILGCYGEGYDAASFIYQAF